MIVYSPLEQFEIMTMHPVFFFDCINVSFTNVSLFMFLVICISLFWLGLSIYKSMILPTYWQIIWEEFYKTMVNTVHENLNVKGEKYFTFIFTLHLFLTFSNTLGMVPYSFTITSHIIFTFGTSLSIFMGMNMIGMKTHGLNFFSTFLPKGVPLVIMPLLVTMEFLSYIVKVFTLAIRLFANMTSGHTLTKMIAGFAWTMLTIGGTLSFTHTIPLVLLVATVGTELAIAVLQAYVFTLLVCIYLNDVLETH
uniref:ATP synthase F0 subunit a n=1 Tax=Bostrychia tenuissima TaxID=196631 RepID=UPI002E76F51E|nr:ATP synthase F0 subunit a [Bostrychia tenuissima]WQF69449.1 ATP synthase F0 subunit a [Bostrychia tenuissima]